MADALAAAPLVQTDAEDCTVEPISFTQLKSLAETATSPATPAAALETDGEIASQDVIDGVTATVQQAIACANANDPLRAFALFTDRSLSERFGPANPDDLDSLQVALSRTPVPADADDILVLHRIDDIQTISDNRAIAIVTTATRDGETTDRLRFERVGETWLIDAWEPAPDRAPAEEE